MNKEQIEEALNYIAQCFPGVEMVNKDDDFASFTPNELAEFIRNYLESKREEIERKAYEAGQESTHNWKDLPKIETYDQWKESKKQEQ